MDNSFQMHDVPSHDNIHSIDRTKKKEANFKHLLNVHHISDILDGKRVRRPPDEVTKCTKSPFLHKLYMVFSTRQSSAEFTR